MEQRHAAHPVPDRRLLLDLARRPPRAPGQVAFRRRRATAEICRRDV